MISKFSVIGIVAITALLINPGNTSAQVFEVKGNGYTIPHLSTNTPSMTNNTDFGTNILASVTTNGFEIFPAGVNLTNTPYVNIAGTHSNDFSVISQPTSPTALAEPFVVSFTPSAIGLRTAVIEIGHDTNGPSPYVFAIQGFGGLPAIDILGNGTSIASGDPSPDAGDNTDFGNAEVGVTIITNTFTITNNGTASLSLTDASPFVTIGGPHSADFALTVTPGSTIASGDSTTFEITFDPTATGSRTGTVSIANNDTNSNPYTFSIQGTGTAPEMDVLGNNISIADGDGSPNAGDDTDFGLAEVAGTITTNIFTITNTGTATLFLTGTDPYVTKSGTHAADFSIVGTPSTNIAAAGFTTFAVTFDPTASGARSASLSIANNDDNENPYNFSIRGTGTVPEIDISGKGVSIADNASSPTTTDDTDFGQVEITGSNITHTFTITNLGTASLLLTDSSPYVTIGGTHSNDFSLTGTPGGTIVSNGYTTFSVTFDPSAVGARSATISIANNDTTENPYNFSITGEGVEPEMQIFGGGYHITNNAITTAASNDTYFGYVSVETGTNDNIFTITNTGAGWLRINGSPKVQVSGTHSNDFSVTTYPGNRISSGASDTFTIRFNPSAEGVRNATLTIPNDDTARNPYVFNISGYGMEPEIDIYGNGTLITDGDSSPGTGDDTDFGDADLDIGIIQNTFTVTNLGSETLLLNGTPTVSISGVNASDFTVTNAPSTSVGTNNFTTFTIAFNPSDTGTRNATISIDNNDISGSEDPYSFNITGNGTIEARIGVTGDGNLVTNGSTTPLLSNYSDFGNVDFTTETQIRTFTITNSGSDHLYLTGIPNVSISGEHSNEFTVTSQPSSPIAKRGGKSTFTIEFDPGATGIRTGIVSIINSDPDDDPYVFTIQGTGVTPEIGLSGNGANITDGDTSPSSTDNTDFGNADWMTNTISKTFTITNTGTGNLAFDATPVVVSGTHASDFTVTTQPTNLVPTGTSVTFTVAFDPAAVGLRTATLTINNNDSDENPFNFDIQGTGTQVPIIGLRGNGVVITNGASAVETNGTDFGNADILADTVDQVFAITNSGSGDLELTGSPIINIIGPAASEFSVTAEPQTSIAARTGTNTFTIAFDPTNTGPRMATVLISNTDSTANPYSFNIQGFGTSTPDIDVLGNGWSIPTGSMIASDTNNTDFGDADIADDVVDREFAITNSGSADLNLVGSGPSISGTHATDFTVTIAPETVIPPGTSTTFTVRFDPIDGGSRSASVMILSDDSNENPYTFNLAGQGTTKSEIDVLGTNGLIMGNASAASSTNGTDFGSVQQNASVTNVFAITNDGSAMLTILDTSISGLSARYFAITNVPETVDVGAVSNFMIIYTPTASGTHTAEIVIENDSADDSYEINVSGIGMIKLVIKSDYGTTIPATGTNWMSLNSFLMAKVFTPTTEVDGTRYSSDGYLGSGAIPVNGSGDSISLQLSVDSTLTWLWTKEYYLTVKNEGLGTLNIESDWQTENSVVPIFAIGLGNNEFSYWTGDIPEGSENDNPLELTMDKVRSVTAVFVTSTNTIIYGNEYVGTGIFNDFDGTNGTDFAVYDSDTGNWYISNLDGNILAWAINSRNQTGTILPGDFDGDGIADLGMLTTRGNMWSIINTSGETLTRGVVEWGWQGADLVAGDYDGDRVSDLAVFDNKSGVWYIYSVEENETIAWQTLWGWPGAEPVSGDYNGDDISDLAVFDTETGYWYIYSLTETLIAWELQWGGPGAVPVSGDYNGDGVSDLCLYDDTRSTWYILSVDGELILWEFQWGWAEADVMAGDFDGDGTDDLVAFDTATSTWYVYSLEKGVIVWGLQWGFEGAELLKR